MRCFCRGNEGSRGRSFPDNTFVKMAQPPSRRTASRSVTPAQVGLLNNRIPSQLSRYTPRGRVAGRLGS